MIIVSRFHSVLQMPGCKCKRAERIFHDLCFMFPVQNAEQLLRNAQLLLIEYPV